MRPFTNAVAILACTIPIPLTLILFLASYLANTSYEQGLYALAGLGPVLIATRPVLVHLYDHSSAVPRDASRNVPSSGQRSVKGDVVRLVVTVAIALLTLIHAFLRTPRYF